MSGIIKELPMISLNNIYKSYGSDEGKVDALKNINLEIEKGEFLALCGPSGSGKSTLLNILSGIDKPTVGTVMFLKNYSTICRKNSSRRSAVDTWVLFFSFSI